MKAARWAAGSSPISLVTEGAASNVFIVHGGCIRTPPHSNHLLPGVTRDLLVELLRAEGMECREEPVSGADLRAAGEIWITGSTIGVAPVIRLDGRPVGTGRPGDCWRRADILYQDFKKAPRPLRAGNAL